MPRYRGLCHADGLSCADGLFRATVTSIWLVACACGPLCASGTVQFPVRHGVPSVDGGEPQDGKREGAENQKVKTQSPARSVSRQTTRFQVNPSFLLGVILVPHRNETNQPPAKGGVESVCVWLPSETFKGRFFSKSSRSLGRVTDSSSTLHIVPRTPHVPLPPSTRHGRRRMARPSFHATSGVDGPDRQPSRAVHRVHGASLVLARSDVQHPGITSIHLPSTSSTSRFRLARSSKLTSH